MGVERVDDFDYEDGLRDRQSQSQGEALDLAISQAAKRHDAFHVGNIVGMLNTRSYFNSGEVLVEFPETLPDTGEPISTIYDLDAAMIQLGVLHPGLFLTKIPDGQWVAGNGKFPPGS